jgi:phosphotriesterase-related protein
MLLSSCGEEEIPYIMTINGEIDPISMGKTLTHEHVLVDFVGADSVSKERYDAEYAFERVLPFIKELNNYNVGTFIEATPAYLGRDVEFLKRLSDASGIKFITNTGYYAANNNKHLPAHFYEESIEQISDRWIDEFEDGIDDTDIKPGFIKISVNEGSLSEADRKLVRAAARTHLETGLTIASHTGKAAGVLEQIQILEEKNVHPSAMIWVHAQEEQDLKKFVGAAQSGIWVSFDGAGWEPVEKYVKLLKHMKKNNVLNKTLISHDAGWYDVDSYYGGTEFTPYTSIFTDLIPALEKNGFRASEIFMLLMENPADAFSIKVRKIM